MASYQELQPSDREFSSEPTEYPIDRAFLHMSTPLIGESDLMFHLQINGEALWQLRQLGGNLDQVFQALQDSLPILGYRLSSSSSARVGNVVNSRVQYVVKKIRNTTNGKKRRAIRSGYWCSVAIHPEEISQHPQQVIKELQGQEETLIRENRKLNQELEGVDALWRRYFHPKINRRDPVRNLLLVEKRQEDQEVLREKEKPEKRAYQIENNLFCWLESAESARKVMRISTEQPESNEMNEAMQFKEGATTCCPP